MSKYIARFSIIVMAIAMLLSGCSKDKNPIGDNDTDHDHAEAVGLVISTNDVELARYDKGAVTGQLEVKAGEETPILTIQFIAEDGDLFQPENEVALLDWEFTDQNIADINQIAEYGKWKFNLFGNKEGTTEITFKIMHGDHADFVAKPIPVEVTE